MKINYFFASFCSFFFVLTTLGANCTHPDYAALAALYNATNGASWTNTTNNDRPWDVTNSANCDPCSWYGVECTNGRVTTIDLRENNLTGTIPNEIGNLAQLERLWLAKNQITSSIPTAIGNLANLNLLYLYENQLSGTIPTEIGNLANLEFLCIYRNNLTGAIPTEIGNLTKLLYFWAFENDLTGGIPAEIGNLTQLIELNLWGNSLMGSIPNLIGNLTNLELLELGNNKTITGVIPSTIGNLTKLKELRLDNNNLTGAIPSSIWNLTALTRLRLHTNPNLTGTIPPEITNLPNLTELSFSGCDLSGQIPQEIGNLTLLTYLDFWDNAFTGSIPTNIANLSNLEFLSFGYNQLSGSLPEEIGMLNNLEYLYLNDNQFNGSIPNDIGNLANLKFLGFGHNQFSGSIPSTIGNLLSLTELWIDYNQITGLIPNTIGNLSNLEKLGLHQNMLNGTIPSEIGNLTKLKELRLSNNQLGDTLPSSLGDLSNLQQLYISDNLLQGSIPKSIGDLENLEFMCLFNNQLSGEIPKSFANLNKLKFLGLYNNQLNGRILSTLAQLSSIESLRLYDNNFDNCIPPSFLTLCGTSVEVQLNNISGGTDYGLDFTNFCNNNTNICPPENDDCDTPTSITVFPDQASCTNLAGTTQHATLFQGGNLNNCVAQNTENGSVWYILPVSDFNNGITITLSNFTGTNGVGVSLYHILGSSCGEAATEGAFEQISCIYHAEMGYLELIINDALSAPTSGFERYLIEVWTANGVNGQGDFDICVYENEGFICEENVITAQTRTELPGVVVAEMTIQSTDTVETGAGVTYVAGQSIILNPGFHAKAGADFMAQIVESPCGPLPPPLFVQESEERSTIKKILDKATLKVFPNPFSYTSTIQFDLATVTPISIHLYDLNGRQIKAIVSNANYGAGIHQLTLESGDLQAGIYYLNMRSEKEQIMRKVMVVK